MNRASYFSRHVRWWRKWPTVGMWLLGGITVLLSLSACTLPLDWRNVVALPTGVPPTAAQEVTLTPKAITETRLGFNVRGWT